MAISSVLPSSPTPLHNTWDGFYQAEKRVMQAAGKFAHRTNVSVIQPTVECVKSCGPVILDGSKKVLNVAWRILEVLVALGIFLAQPTLFLAGAAIAMVFPDQMRKAISHISDVWFSLPRVVKILISVTAPFEFASYCFIAAPFVGAHVSLCLQDRAGVPRQPTPLSIPNITSIPSPRGPSPISDEKS